MTCQCLRKGEIKPRIITCLSITTNTDNNWLSTILVISLSASGSKTEGCLSAANKSVSKFRMDRLYATHPWSTGPTPVAKSHKRSHIHITNQEKMFLQPTYSLDDFICRLV